MHGKKLKDCMSPDKYDEWCKKNGNCYWCNNGTIETKIKNGQPIPEGFTKGRLKETNEKVRLANIGKKMSKVSIEKMIETKRKNGTIKRSKESVEKQFKTRKERGISCATNTGKKWYTNGIESKFFLPNEVPTGWYKGRICKRK
jgi:hypothetical protein